jgi:hypothetical protein
MVMASIKFWSGRRCPLAPGFSTPEVRFEMIDAAINS